MQPGGQLPGGGDSDNPSGANQADGRDQNGGSLSAPRKLLEPSTCGRFLPPAAAPGPAQWPPGNGGPAGKGLLPLLLQHCEHLSPEGEWGAHGPQPFHHQQGTAGEQTNGVMW